MKIETTGDGAQITVENGHAVLVTVRPHPEYGFKGSVLTKNAKGEMQIVEFHGDGIAGTCVHEPEPFVAEEEETED
jgi:hypothetical protein